MSMQRMMDQYNKRLSQKQQEFRDLFGKQELQEAMKKYRVECGSCTMLDFLDHEIKRKLREQDND